MEAPTGVTPSSAPQAPAPALALDGVVAERHQRNLRLLQRIPLLPDYVNPPEIMILVRLSAEYGIDWTLGLEDLKGHLFVTVRNDAHGDPKPVSVRVRVRPWPNSADLPQHRFIPDMGARHAHVLVGLLAAAIRLAIEEERP